MRQHAWAYLIAVVLLGLFFAQAAGNLSAQSPVVDEPSHIARAMAYWRVGDLRLQLGHPPLIHALAGLPLLLEPSVPNVASLPGWQGPFDRETLNYHALWDEGRATDRIVYLTRWPVLMLGVLLGALMFRWAGERFGLWAALAALFLFAFDPNLLAHSALITTDLPVTFFILLAVYSFDRWMHRPSRRWLVISGITFGLALTSKFTAVILVPVILLLALVCAWRNKRLMQTFWALIVLFAIGAFVVWAVYRFEVGRPPVLPVSVPAPKFVDGLLRVQERDEEGRMAFLLGKMNTRGWWYYFPMAFAVKTPLPTLILLGAAMISGVAWVCRMVTRRDWPALGQQVQPALALLLLPVLLFAISMTSKQDLGYRYILPVTPFLFIQIAALAPNAKPGISVRNVLLILCGAWLVIGAALIYPYHLAYFNEAAGGPDNGYRILADSNVDWGQDVKRLKAWLAGHAPGVQVNLSLFTGSVPERYGIHARPLPGPYQSPDENGFQRFAPAPGVYAISASAWQGLRFHNPDTFDWFRRQTPVARIGHSLFVYDVQPLPSTEKWAAVCYAPDGPIDGDGLAAGLGRTDLRSIFFDCRNAWVYLHGDQGSPLGSGPGYYVVPAHGDPMIADEMMLGRGVPIYHDRGDADLSKDYPGFTLYRWDGEAQARARIEARIRPPGGEFDFGPASLIGYELDQGPFTPGGVISMTTWWRANSPGEVLLSAYAHLSSGDRLVNSDGLGVPPQMWQTGDIIAQRHAFKIPSDWPVGDYALHVGLYSVETNRRYPLRVNGQPGDDYPLLTTLRLNK